MARWRLTEAHYINVPGTRWEYSETDRITGKPKRVPFDVPLYLNPLDPGDWNERISPEEGYINVTDGNNAQPKDIRFLGPPTPGMKPLDAEAEEISGQFEWKPTMGLDDASQANSFSNQLLSGLVDKLVDAQAAVGAATPAAMKIEGLDQMMAAMSKMMEQNQLLIQHALGSRESASTRRVG